MYARVNFGVDFVTWYCCSVMSRVRVMTSKNVALARASLSSGNIAHFCRCEKISAIVVSSFNKTLSNIS